jgi:DNA repair exonuclease SbcCD nuclease subunit
MLKLLHAADLHLDTPLKGLLETRGVSEPAARCTLDAFTRVIDLALREGVDGVLLAGDLFDRADRSLRARLHLGAQLDRLHRAGIPSFLVAGNHDPLGPDDPRLALPPSTTVFGASWSEVLVERPQGRFRVQGVSHPQAEVSENLSRLFHRAGPEPTVGLLHCNVGGRLAHANYAPCSVADLAGADLDYWALGHVHTRESFQAGRALAAYPGNPQGRHVRETGPRGCLLVELDASGQRPPAARFLATDVLRWHWLRVDLEGHESIASVLAEIEGRAAASAGEASFVHTHVFRVTLEGRSMLHGDLSRPESKAALDERLAELFAPRQWLLESVEVASSAMWQLAEVLAAGGLAGEVARWLDEPVADAALEAVWKDAGLGGLDEQLAFARVDGLDRRATLAAAARRALGLLLEVER